MKSSSSSSPSSWPARPRRIFKVSSACSAPKVPGTGPNTPASAQLPTTPSATASGQRPAQAGMAGLRLVHLQLALVLVDAGKNRGPAGEHGGVVDEVLGAEIVAAIDDHIVGADQRQGIVRVQPQGMRFKPATVGLMRNTAARASAALGSPARARS